MQDKPLFLVTGATGGIGQSACQILSEKGFVPVVCYRKPKEVLGQTVAQDCGGIAIELDLSDASSISNAIETLKADGRTVGGVCLLASPPPILKRFTHTDVNDLKLFWEVNVLGNQVLLSAIISEFFRKNKKGYVCAALTAAMGESGQAGMSHMGSYVVSKFGLQGILSVVQAEYPWLSVHSIKPTYTDTSMLEAFDERWIEQVRKTQGIMEPHDVAQELLEHVAL